MKILCVFGEHAYGDPSRGEGIEHANFLPALRRLGHQVSFFESFSREPYANFAALNRALLDKVEETAPEVVFCVLMQYEVWIETMRLIRNSGAWLVNWSTDDSWKYSMFSKLIGTECDLFVTTYPELVDRYHRDGIGSVYLSQWAANAETLAPPVSAASCRYPVSFVGAAYGNRPAMIDRLRREGIDVVCFGHGWPGGPVEAKRVGEIIRESQVSLNFSEGAHGNSGDSSGRQIKARVFEVPGYGGCLLTERAPNIERYFRDGEEILSFEGEDELVREVKSLLDGSSRRDRIAQRGFERVQREHTYDHRFNEMLKELTGRVARRSRLSIGWAEFEVAADRHRLSPVFKMIRSVLISIASIIWGRQRGPRAARRLAFELSWRLRGAWTYSAAGWPGRLFYRES
ncbi:MAG: glycosyltransferase [Nitrospira sp.]|nr:glycosyltransferase [Nitrospira sp.]